MNEAEMKRSRSIDKKGKDKTREDGEKRNKKTTEELFSHMKANT